MQSQQSLRMLSQHAEIGWQQQQTAQAPSTMMQMPGQHSQSQPLLQSLMPQLQPQAGPYEQQLGLQHQPNTLQRDMQQRLHLSGVQLQNVMEQKQIQSQRVLPEASSTEWQEEAYPKIKAMKDMYLPDLTEMYQKVCAKLQQQEVLAQPKEHVEKLKSPKLYLERILQFLQVAKINIPPSRNEKLGSYEKQIVQLLNSHRGKKPIPSHQGQQQLQTSGGHALSMPHQRQPQSQISQQQQQQQNENHMNPKMQPMNIPNSGTSVQPSAVTSMPHARWCGIKTTNQEWKAQGDSVWPAIKVKIPDYPGGLNLQHSIEYWLTFILDLLSSSFRDQNGAYSAVRVVNSSGADVVFVSFFSSLSYNRHSKNGYLKETPSYFGTRGITELNKIAVRFEEKIYMAATSQSDYLRKISLKMLTMETKSQNTGVPTNSAVSGQNPADPGSHSMQSQVRNQGPPSVALSNQSQVRQQLMSQNIQNTTTSGGVQNSNSLPSALSSVTGLTPSNMTNAIGQSSNLQNMSGISQNTGVQGVPSNIFTNTQRQMPGRQHPQQIASQPNQQQPSNSQQYMYQQQIMKQKLQQGNIQSSMMQSHLQQQNLLQSTQLSQQSLSQQSLHMMSQQAKIGGQQQQTAQAPSTMMQMPGQQSQSQPLQQSMMPQLQPQAGQYQQQLGLQHQPNTLQRDLQQRLHLSGVQPQTVMEQKQIQAQRVLPEASSTSIDSTAQTGNANTADWQEEAYQKIKAMKDTYFPDLTEMYQKVCAKLQQQEVLTQPKEQIEKLKSLKLYLERMLHFLQVAKNNIPAGYKEKLGSYEKQIVQFLNSHRGKKPIPSHQGQQQLQTSGGHTLSMPHQQQPQSQISQLQQHENHMNPQMQPMNIPNSGTSVQPGAVTSMPHGTLPSLSTQLGVPATQANVMSSLQSGSALDMGQGSASSSLQLGGQRTPYHHPQLKPGAQFPISSPQLHPAPSPQHSSPQIDQQNLLTTFPKSGTPLQSANSPFIVPSPSTPLAPSPIPGDTEKQASGISSLSNTGHVGHPQPTAVLAPAHSLAIGTPGISASPLLAEFTTTDANQGTEQPLERLLKAVKAISPKAFSASVSDIGSVISMIDRIAGSAPGNGSRAAVGEDLVAMTKCRMQARNFISQDGVSATKKMRRDTSAMPLNAVSSAGSVNDSLKQSNVLEMSDLESTATSRIKRPRVEANHALLEEIKEINQRLIDTVVDISDEDVDPTVAAAAAEGGQGIIVKCSFNAVSLSPNLKTQYASAQMTPIHPLQLLIPTNYPNCSPVLLDKLPIDLSKENEDLSVKTRSRFSISLRSLSQPMSLKEMVRTWDICARAAISDYAQQHGGGSFSSRYGTWEKCVSAA
ncbi:hypothetical protein IFM89_008413 [Coptis chinensis]|uniref:Mediator complex subunit 15 KIX domain-containing protein n=1 Tax=Coptis chinensis TaxID=261450 RepID=A0A835HBY1_9MAGN|nr:hypothetical protein IFM89_008413 [Coptis chinensis]